MPDIAPAEQAKALKRLAMIMLFTGLMIGVGLPVLFMAFEVQAVMTLWGFDVLWLVALAIMIFDFGLARMFWRRAMALEQGRCTSSAGAAPLAPPARRQAEPRGRAARRHPGDVVALGARPSSPARGGRAQALAPPGAPLDWRAMPACADWSKARPSPSI